LRTLLLILPLAIAVAFLAAVALNILVFATIRIAARLRLARVNWLRLLIVRHQRQLHCCPPMLRQQAQAPSVPAKSK